MERVGTPRVSLGLSRQDGAGVSPGQIMSQDLFERFRRGEAAAFEKVMRDYGGVVRSVVRRRIFGVFLQDEAMQEVWIHVYKNRTAVDPTRLDSFPGWLATVAHRKCIDLLRKAGRVPATVGDEELATASVEPVQDEAVEARELLGAAAQFMGGLEPLWGEFFKLHFVEGLQYDEVGKRLGIGKVRCKYMKKVLAMRARRNRALMTALGHYRRGGGEDAP